MAVQIALFRGINVGKAKRVAMADLRTLFEGLGFKNVRTLLNSGNVVIVAGADRKPLQILVDKAASEHVALGAAALYLCCPEGILESPFAGKLVGPAFRDSITSRNWSTVLKLQSLAASNG